MMRDSIRYLFLGRFFVVPNYHRSYVWERQHVMDFFDDITVSFETGRGHFVGIFVFVRTDIPDKYYVVDGVQRIATIMLIISRLLISLDDADAAYYRRFYINKCDEYKLAPFGVDAEYFKNVLNGNPPEPRNVYQSLLKEAAEEICLKVQNVKDKIKFMEYVEAMQLVEFIVDTEGDASRIFETINCRGKK